MPFRQREGCLPTGLVPELFQSELRRLALGEGEDAVPDRDGGGELLHAVHNADEDRDTGFFFDY